MDINVYRSNLDAVIREFGPATFDSVAGICPHLTEQEVRDLLFRAQHSIDLIEFAVPSVLVAHSYHVCGIAPPQKCSGFLAYSRHKRTPESFADGKGRYSYPEQRVPLFVDKALQYANQQWGTRLITDDWQSVVKYKLYQPQHQGKETRRVRLLREVAVALSVSATELATRQPDEAARQLNEAIVHMSDRVCEQRELAGGRQLCEFNNCACCGKALDLSTCNVCGIDWCFQPEAPLPVPAKVLEQFGAPEEEEPSPAAGRQTGLDKD